MVWEDQTKEIVRVDSVTPETKDQDYVSVQLQQLYEYILDDRRPEAVAETERLADQLGVEIERPSSDPERAHQ